MKVIEAKATAWVTLFLVPPKSMATHWAPFQKKPLQAAQKYGIMELELTGLVCNIHGFSQLLKNHYFEVLVDHKANWKVTKVKKWISYK